MSVTVSYIEVNNHTIPMTEIVKPYDWDFQDVFKHKEDDEVVFLVIDKDNTVYLFTTLPSVRFITSEWVLPDNEKHFDDFVYIGHSNLELSLEYHSDMWLQTMHPMTLKEAKEMINDFSS